MSALTCPSGPPRMKSESSVQMSRERHLRHGLHVLVPESFCGDR